MKSRSAPWAHLDEYRGEGRIFNTEWPTLPQMLEVSAARFPNNPCFTAFDAAGTKVTLSYSEVLSRVRTLANWMADNNVASGDRVAVTGHNCPEWAIVYFAALTAGAIIVPIDHALHTAEVENLLCTAAPKMLFADAEKISSLNSTASSPLSSVAYRGEQSATTVPAMGIYPLETIQTLRPVSDEGGSSEPNSVAGTAGRGGVVRSDEGGSSRRTRPPRPSDAAAILFTSGTMGDPKGVVLTHENLVSDCFIAQMNFHHAPPDVFYALLPIHHAYTMQAALINPLSQGDEIVFGKSMAVTRLMQELRDGGITVMLGVPLLYNKLLAGIQKGIRERGAAVAAAMKILMAFSYAVCKVTGHNIGKVLFKSVLKKANIYTLRVAICGGGPLSPKVFKAFNALGIDFIQGYGLTETSPIIALNPIEHFKIHSVGKDFYPREEVRILDPNEHGIGEIAVKGPMVMQGYYNMEEDTRAMFTEDGFLRTGDMGWIDREHYIMLCGRNKNIIVTSGGKNVFPEEIEDAFQLCGDIQQITVKGYTTGGSVAEEVEALVYPSDDLYRRLGIDRATAYDAADVMLAIQHHIDIANKTFQPYARISRLTILAAPLEMTTTMKVKRGKR